MEQGIDRDKVKQILRFFRDIDEAIALNRRIIRDLEDTYYIINGISIDGMPKGKNTASSLTETVALSVPDSTADSIRYLNNECDRLDKLKTAIIKELDGLTVIQKIIIYDFYIHNPQIQWEQISERVHYSVRRCKDIRNYALDILGLRFSKNNHITGYDYPS